MDDQPPFKIVPMEHVTVGELGRDFSAFVVAQGDVVAPHFEAVRPTEPVR